LKPEAKKGLIHYYAYTSEAQAWGCLCHPKKYPRSTSFKAWGCPEAPPSSSAKIRSPFKTLYFYCFMHYAFFLERQLLLFSVFFCFVCCNKYLDHIMCLERDMLRFSFVKNTPFFTLIVSTSVLFFCYCV
jgi:hypothetical protein